MVAVRSPLVRGPIVISLTLVSLVSVVTATGTAHAGRAPAGAAAPTYTLPTMPERPSSLVMVGDSVADGAAPALAAEAARRGSALQAFSRVGCGITDGVPVDTGNAATSAQCVRDNEGFLAGAAARPVDAVIVWSSWEVNSHVVEGQRLDFRTPEWDAWMTRQLDGLYLRFGRVPMLLATTAPRAPLPGGVLTMTPEEVEDVRRYGEFLRNYAALRAGEVGIVDVDRILCPGGSCPEALDGIVVRPDLGAHFDNAGADWLAPWILDAVQRAWEQIGAVATAPLGF
jgi:hypothetical protein